jgi:threonine/homoserine/homoserine lactone efflux protein
MHPQHPFVPYGLITFGAIYIAKPDIFYMWMSRRNEQGQRRAMPQQNKAFMRALGLVFIVVGMVLLMRSAQG